MSDKLSENSLILAVIKRLYFHFHFFLFLFHNHNHHHNHHLFLHHNIIDDLS